MMRGMKAKIKALMFLNGIFWGKAKGVFIYNIFNCVIFGPLIQVCDVIMVQVVMDALLDGKDVAYVVLLAVILCGVQIIGGIIQLGVAYFVLEKNNLRLRSEITKDFLLKIKRFDYHYLDNPEYLNKLQYVAGDFANKVISAQGFLSQILTNVSTIAAVFTIIISLNRPLIIIFSIVYTILAAVLRGRITKIGFEKNQEFIPANRKCGYYESIYKDRAYSMDIRCTRLSDIVLEEYDKNIEVQKETVKKYSRKLAVPNIARNTLAIAVYCLCMSYIGVSLSADALSQVTILPTLLSSYSKLSSNLNSIFSLDAQLTEISLFYEKYDELMKLKCEIENIDGSQNKSKINTEPFDIVFDNVSFTYPGSNFSIRNLNLHIKKGETVGIVGVNGAGKTTLTKLILRLYDVESGVIRINGRNIKDYSPYELRYLIGYASQSPNLYSFTVRQNLSLYNSPSDDEISDILDNMSFSEILNKFNANIDSQINKSFDPDGIMLSGGEAQRLAIARILTGKFGIFICDEPTAALDPFSEKEVMDRIYQRASGSTALIIAHRLSTIKNADRIIVLDNGQVIEEGTHDELLRMDGKYKEMFYAQAENYQIDV